VAEHDGLSYLTESEEKILPNRCPFRSRENLIFNARQTVAMPHHRPERCLSLLSTNQVCYIFARSSPCAFKPACWLSRTPAHRAFSILFCFFGSPS
jgi:hypothetical protein